jgi:hypothetical protein
MAVGWGPCVGRSGATREIFPLLACFVIASRHAVEKRGQQTVVALGKRIK